MSISRVMADGIATHRAAVAVAQARIRNKVFMRGPMALAGLGRERRLALSRAS
jgi:hypothetical protein